MEYIDSGVERSATESVGTPDHVRTREGGRGCVADAETETALMLSSLLCRLTSNKHMVIRKECTQCVYS